MNEFRDHNFLGTTQSLCPECLTLVQAKIVVRDDRVYFRKFCPTHGVREDFVCSDVRMFDRTEYSLPGKIPTAYGTEYKRGCPYDCGLCVEHEQHTCIGLLEITSNCNLECPICFAGSGPGGEHLTFEQCRMAIDRLVAVETRPEVLQLSGGEPTIHPDFFQILEYACDQPIDIVMINTNGIRIARDRRFVERLEKLRNRCEVYFQFDSFDEGPTEALRGQSLVELKLKAIEILGEAGIRTTLVCTVQSGVNDDQLGAVVEYAMSRPWITGVSFQPTTYTGRYFLPETLEKRVTFPDVLKGIEQQTNGEWAVSDFTPLPCAHPNAHTLAYAYREFGDDGVRFLPLARFMDLEQHLDLLSGRITFDRQRARSLIQSFLERQSCGSGGCSPDEMVSGMGDFVRRDNKGAGVIGSDSLNGDSPNADLSAAFFLKTLSQSLDPEDMLRVTTTSFMDAYNFDIRQLMKSCVHQVLPSGHLIPFSAYNVLYRDGHVALPTLHRSGLVSLASS